MGAKGEGHKKGTPKGPAHITRLLQPVGFRFYAFLTVQTAATCCFGLIMRSTSALAGCILGWTIIMVWLGSGGVWLFSLLRNRSNSTASKWRWAPAPFIVLIAICFGATFDLNFAIARPGLERYCARVMQLPPGTPLPPPNVFLQPPISKPHRLPHGVRFSIYVGGGLFDDQGLAWSTSPPPVFKTGVITDPDHYMPEEIEHTEKYLGDWYKWWGF